MRISDWSSDVCSSDLPARIDLANRSGAAADISRLREAIPGLEVGLESGTDAEATNRATLLLDREGVAALARLAAPVSADATGRACRLPRVGEPAPARHELIDQIGRAHVCTPVNN